MGLPICRLPFFQPVHKRVASPALTPSQPPLIPEVGLGDPGCPKRFFYQSEKKCAVAPGNSACTSPADNAKIEETPGLPFPVIDASLLCRNSRRCPIAAREASSGEQLLA
jgi:hypothetical protein